MKNILVLFSVLTLSSCVYNKEEMPVPDANSPVEIGPGITYNNHTKRLFDTYCISCHAPAASQQFFPLTNFAEVSVYSNTGGLIQSRVLDQMSMPPSGSQTGQLTTAEKDTLQMWLDQGALQ